MPVQMVRSDSSVLRETRAKLGMTQQQVADKARIQLRQYQRLENGERQIFTSTFDTSCRVLEALGLDPLKYIHGEYVLGEEFDLFAKKEKKAQNNFLDARKFTFEEFPHPLHPDDTGDSGTLEIAASKLNPDERYIVKRGFPELACNEFMYHKIASALGLYTQEVKLISGSGDYRRACAIRYVPNAKAFNPREIGGTNKQVFYAFEALFAILCEEDSHEYYVDEEDCVFKLDNAASFMVSQMTIMWFDGDRMTRGLIPDILEPLRRLDNRGFYEQMEVLKKDYGKPAAESYLAFIRRFADFDASVLEEAFETLDKQYSRLLARYYAFFINLRKKACREFLEEIK